MVKEIRLTDTHLTVADTLATHTYELVDSIPLGYSIWNIGPSNMAPGYLPLCRPLLPQPFDGARRIDGDSLKAIKVDGAEHVLIAIRSGDNTIAKMKRYIKRHQDSKDVDWVKRSIELYEKAIQVLETVPGGELLR